MYITMTVNILTDAWSISFNVGVVVDVPVGEVLLEERALRAFCDPGSVQLKYEDEHWTRSLSPAYRVCELVKGLPP